jgi:hypothetical protein
MSHEEFDYDILFTALDHTSVGFLPPPPQAYTFAEGFDTRFLLSFGPFDISPGQKLPVSFAWVGGDDFHQHPTDWENFFQADYPLTYYHSLNFDNLATTARWASWVYDNPGVDTDGDGFAGPTRVCHDALTGNADTSYYAGDGVPDFQGAGPPPAPHMRLIPSWEKIIVRWNGFYSENTRDIFSKLKDFEGYRIYLGRDDRPNSFSLVTSFDHENYNRFLLVLGSDGSREWVLSEIPFTLDSLRAVFQDPDLDPEIYTRERPYQFQGAYYYFQPQDFNASDLSETGIRRVFPDLPRPPDDPDLWRPEDLMYDYGVPLPKFYEYEFTIEHLLPSVDYYVAVTTFDFGSPIVDLPALETSPTNNVVAAYPQPASEQVTAENLDVFVYPNPYRTDADYRELGFESRTITSRSDDHVRALHFGNLPSTCTIRIYSLDGDLIIQIDHDRVPTDPKAAHDEWDLITRNRQSVVSGLYYYVVESASRTQIGKFAIIR